MNNLLLYTIPVKNFYGVAKYIPVFFLAFLSFLVAISYKHIYSIAIRATGQTFRSSSWSKCICVQITQYVYFSSIYFKDESKFCPRVLIQDFAFSISQYGTITYIVHTFSCVTFPSAFWPIVQRSEFLILKVNNREHTLNIVLNHSCYEKGSIGQSHITKTSRRKS